MRCWRKGGEMTASVNARDAHDATLWEPADGGAVRCRLCGHRCEIRPGQLGRCRVRKNVDGTLKTLVYDQICAMHVDPIEKKPLFHVLPGSRSLSIATPGCNFTCTFCQCLHASMI